MKYLINTFKILLKKSIIIDLFYKKYYLFINVSLRKIKKKKKKAKYNTFMFLIFFYLIIIYKNKNIF